MHKKLFVFICFFSQIVFSKTVEEVQSFYKPMLAIFQAYVPQELSLDHARILQCNNSFITCFDGSVSKFIKQLRKDLVAVKKEVRRNQTEELVDCYDGLSLLYHYLKKQRVNLDAALFHAKLKKKYDKLLHMIAQGKDVIDYIHTHRKLFEIDANDQKFLKTFLNILAQERHRVSQLEDYLHTDYIDLKLTNYVFKIELVKVRNEIRLDSRYKKGLGC